MDRAPHAFLVATWGGHQTRNRTGHGRYTAVGLGARLRKTPQRPPYVLGSVNVWNTPDVWPYESRRLARMGLPTRGSSFPPVRRLKESSEDGSTALTPDLGLTVAVGLPGGGSRGARAPGGTSPVLRHLGRRACARVVWRLLNVLSVLNLLNARFEQLQ